MPPTMRHVNLDTMFEAPWALMPKTLSRILDWSRQVPAMRLDASTIVALDGPHEGAIRAGTVSVLPVYGVIEHHANWMLDMFGGVSIESLRETLRTEMSDPSVKAIVLDIDSPGGTVAGVTEFAAEIRAARGGPKPIIAVANTLAASAAYWLASQADELVVSPSGSVGAIGIYAVHQEASRMLDEMGITTTIISAGPHKTEANEFEPLTDEARADLQARADAAYAQFLADVAAGRRVPVAQVEADYGGGRVLVAKKALAAGMIDRIATLAQTVQRLGRVASSTNRRGGAMGAIVEFEARAIGRHKTATSEDTFDHDVNLKRLPSGNPGDGKRLREAHAWMEEGGDPDIKASYRFFHHFVSEDARVGAASTEACSNKIGVLNGGRGGTTIPDDDIPGVYDHLAGHLRDAGREPPTLKVQAPFSERIAALATDAAELTEHATERARLRAKEGRPAFSTATERSLRTIREAIDELLTPDDPGASAATAEPVEPAPAGPSTPPPAAVPKRFRSREEWLRHLEASAHR